MSVEDVTVLVDYTVRKFCIQQVLSPTSFLSSHLGSADHERAEQHGPSSFLLKVVRKAECVVCLDSETRDLGSQGTSLLKLMEEHFHE